jgi:glycosyltransferase involved in cell wall biosynthesis
VSGNGDSVDFERERPAFKSDVHQLVEDLNMENNVLFVKATSEEMPQYMNASDVILYPTIMPQGEAFGIAPVEAMACSRPVIVTNSGGLVESTYHNINGIVVDKDPDKLAVALAKNIDRLLTDHEMADYLGRNGRELAMERFDSKKMALRMEDLYNRLANDSIVQKVNRMDTLVKSKPGFKKVGANAFTKMI